MSAFPARMSPFGCQPTTPIDRMARETAGTVWSRAKAEKQAYRFGIQIIICVAQLFRFGSGGDRMLGRSSGSRLEMSPSAVSFVGPIRQSLRNEGA